MTRRKLNLQAEGERIAREYEQLLGEVEAAQAAAERERARLSAARALGELDDAAAREQWTKTAADLDAMKERLQVLRDAIPEIARRAAEEEVGKRRGERQRVAKEVNSALGGRFSAAKNLARALRDVELSIGEVERHRALVDEALTAYEELADGEPVELPPNADEAWEVSQEVIDFLVAGARQPLADAARKVEAEEQRRAQQEDELLTWFEQRPIAARKRQLPEHLRDHERVAAAEAEWDEKLAKQQAANKKPERGEVKEDRELAVVL